ncbi:MAG: histidine phosphatase family protein [Candidatus Alkaliphilus sp. MAG34]
MDIIMIRHGKTEDNTTKIFGRDDTVLSKQGREQIERTKILLKEYRFKNVYYSPLVRAKETLDILELQGISDSRIKEMNFGIFTGHTYNQLLEKYPKEIGLWTDNTNTYKIPQGESLDMVYYRVKEFLEEISEQDENTVVVTHDGVIKLAFCWVFNNLDLFFKFKIDNGSINIISVNDNFKLIKKLNYF